MMAFMIIAATIEAPRMVQQIKRDREEEMIHRGTEYARAIKKFYKKTGRYPASLDDLDKGQVRYLRKRYKDPLTKDGKWKLLNYGDIQSLLNNNAPGTPAGALGSQGQSTFGQPQVQTINAAPSGSAAFAPGPGHRPQPAAAATPQIGGNIGGGAVTRRPAREQSFCQHLQHGIEQLEFQSAGRDRQLLRAEQFALRPEHARAAHRPSAAGPSSA